MLSFKDEKMLIRIDRYFIDRIFSLPYSSELIFLSILSMISTDSSVTCGFSFVDVEIPSTLPTSSWAITWIEEFRYSSYRNILFCNTLLQGVETYLLLLALKIRYPDRVFMLRGNHEDCNSGTIYGFYDECRAKFRRDGEAVSLTYRNQLYSTVSQAWTHFISVFNWMPVSAIVAEKILCMHGGLSPHLTSLQQIDNVSTVVYRNPLGTVSYRTLCSSLARRSFLLTDSWPICCGLIPTTRHRTLLPYPSHHTLTVSWLVDVTSQDFILLRRQYCQILLCQLQNRFDRTSPSNDAGGTVSSSLIYRILPYFQMKGGYKFFADGRLLSIFSAPNYDNGDNKSCVLRVNTDLKCKLMLTGVTVVRYLTVFSHYTGLL